MAEVSTAESSLNDRADKVSSTGDKKSDLEFSPGMNPREMLEKLAKIETSITGKELPSSWPQIISEDEEKAGYQVLYDPEDDKDQEPKHQHIDRLSYTLTNGDKRLRYLAVQHIRGLENKNHPQFAALKKNFEELKPQIVLYEGPQGNPTSMSEDYAYQYGEKAYLQYLVLEHNKNLRPGEQPIAMESCDFQPEDEPEEYRRRGYTNEEIAAGEVLRWMYYDASRITNIPDLPTEQRNEEIKALQDKYNADLIAHINPEFFPWVPRNDGKEWNQELVREEIEKQTGRPLQVDFNYLQIPRFKQMYDDSRQFRDQYVVRKIAEAGKKYDRVMTVMGSGHAIRDKEALEEFYEAKAE